MTHALSDWQRAWLALGVALALHVADEAAHGFLQWYNPIATRIQAWLGGFSFPPTFAFRTWLTGLIALVLLCLAATPLFRTRRGWLVPIAAFWSLIHIGNGLLHLAASVWAGRMLPGTWTAPILLIAAANLLFRTSRAWRGAP